MILDTSALIAVIREETGHGQLIEAIDNSPQIGIGTPTLTETSIVLVRRFGLAGRSILARFLEENDVIVVPFEDRHWRTAGEAFIRFGKGRHPAALNYGDCMTYAIASLAEEPLLFVGDDFAKTDLASALA